MDRSPRIDRVSLEDNSFPTISIDPPTPAHPASSTLQQNTATSSSNAPPPRVRPQSIRIRRLPSASSVRLANAQGSQGGRSDEDVRSTGRPRSTSEPQQPHFPATPGIEYTQPVRMDTLDEETSNPGLRPSDALNRSATVGGRLRRASSAARMALSRNTISSSAAPETAEQEYDSRIVDLLDVIDPEVSTLTTLTNVQNSLFVPDLGRWLNRMPTYQLSRRPTGIPEQQTPPVSQVLTRWKTAAERQEDEEVEEAAEAIATREQTRKEGAASDQEEPCYAVLPDGVSLEGWSEEDKQELNDHVRHFLHSRRSKFKRSMRAFGKYVRRPLGFFVTLYAVLITLFGLAWVLFLIGWVNVGGRQLYIINVIDNVLVALFAVMGDGLAPFRTVDTYHMCFIAHYHHLTWRLRREQAMPTLQDHNDLPKVLPKDGDDLEAAATGKKELSMLSPLQQKRLDHHQKKFSKSHSFYKPHETMTHHAFPLRLLVAVVCLLDCHSLFQIALGSCTWGISYHHRNPAITPTILCCSITCNITAGILIMVGDRKTRKKDVIKKLFMQQLTQEAMRKVERRKTKEKERSVADGLEDGEDLNLTSQPKLKSKSR